MSKAAILEDEGTEGNANEYTTWHDMKISDANPGSTKVGSQSLKVQKTAIAGSDCAGVRALSNNFYWRDFEFFIIWIYRPSGMLKDSSDTLHLVLMTGGEIGNNPGKGVSIPIGNQTADTWVQYRITKAMFKRMWHYVNDDTSIKQMVWFYSKNSGERNDFVYVDGLDMNYIPYSFIYNPFFLILGMFTGGFLILVLARFSSNRKKRSQELIKKDRVQDVVAVAERRLQCAFCGGQIAEEMKYCTWCGKEIPQCMVCRLPIFHGDDFVECPSCRSFAHRTHLIEWIKTTGHCPHCKVRLTEFDVPK